MTTNSSEPLAGVDTESTPLDVDEADVRAALSSTIPSDRRRGLDVCETLAATNFDALRPLLEDVASLTVDDHAAIALRAVSVLETVAERDPYALADNVAALVDAVETEITDVRQVGATALATLVLKRPALVAPYTGQLTDVVRATAPAPEHPDFRDAVDDEVTRRALQTHEMEERNRRVAGRRTLLNVVVAAVETDPRTGVEIVEGLAALFDDADPVVVGGAIDALGELAAANSEPVEPVSERLIDCLDHERVSVRARTVRALGCLGNETAVPQLQAVATEDPDEAVRKLADETATFLAGAP